ncbi:phosphotransferase family protein [Amycolatopsis sp. K13G38]|uniref:Phosphotransferase family protein n=1 Tax=Amycolatopsis acididurans TaxID=2724524 RepID=A0ABX1IVW5_9PSEU|nr:phosphotransferase family protein [Amycolatopsis acididurans]NKQ51613.1 phosphotransferase family protein [Amycolatopsis acididurans]
MTASLTGWLAERTGNPGPWTTRRLTGGNSNETCLVSTGEVTYVLRRPPAHSLSASAHSVSREHRLLTALDPTEVPVPHPVALSEDPPALVMEHIPDAVSLTSELPATYGEDAVTRVADQVVDALAAVHTLDWRAAGLTGFGRPEGFLERQPERWYKQWRSIARRPLPTLERLAEWLERERREGGPPALLHGDFHVDNCLFSAREPKLLAVIDWEMATIGDPLLDLGLLLALWGQHQGMAWIQGFSRAPGAPPREHLLARYEDATGRRVRDIRYYQCLALFKLAAIVEAAWSQYLDGQLDTEYAAGLEHDVPALLADAAALAGL